MSNTAWKSSTYLLQLLPPDTKFRYKSMDGSANLISSLCILSHLWAIVSICWSSSREASVLPCIWWKQLASSFSTAHGKGECDPALTRCTSCLPGAERPVAVASPFHYSWLMQECLAGKTILTLSMTFSWREVCPPSSGGIITFPWVRLDHLHMSCAIMGVFCELLLGL